MRRGGPVCITPFVLGGAGAPCVIIDFGKAAVDTGQLKNDAAVVGGLRPASTVMNGARVAIKLGVRPCGHRAGCCGPHAQNGGSRSSRALRLAFPQPMKYSVLAACVVAAQFAKAADSIARIGRAAARPNAVCEHIAHNPLALGVRMAAREETHYGLIKDPCARRCPACTIAGG